MRLFLHSLRLYALVTWVGGLLFFAFTLAPTAFHILPIHEAGLIVGASLPILHRTGFCCGFLFLAATLLMRPRMVRHSIPLILWMMALTFYIQSSILPAMEHDRTQAGGDIATAAPDDVARRDFDRLHKRSEQLEGCVLLLGLAGVVLVEIEHRPTGSKAV